MDFKFSTEDVAFREEVLDFLGDQLPPGWADLSEGPAEDGAANRERWEFTRGFHRALAERGWLTLGWPTEHGGAGAGPVRQAMFNETMAHHRAPVYNQGVDRVGPTVIMVRLGRTERVLPAADSVGGHPVVPGILGAGVGIGPGLAADAGSARR